MTDKFLLVGGKASGIYNAGTDGGATGTGRASRALQLRSSRGQMQWGLQLQSNNDIPHLKDAHYDLNAAVMVKFKILNGIGIAYNKAVPQAYTDEMLTKGFDSSSSAWVLGAEYHYEKWHFSSTFSENRSHVTDDQLQYYDARGFELFSSYKLDARDTIRFGLNQQRPTDERDYLGEHKIAEYYLSWQFNYNKKNLEDSAYIEYVYNRAD